MPTTNQSPKITTTGQEACQSVHATVWVPKVCMLFHMPRKPRINQSIMKHQTEASCFGAAVAQPAAVHHNGTHNCHRLPPLAAQTTIFSSHRYSGRSPLVCHAKVSPKTSHPKTAKCQSLMPKMFLRYMVLFLPSLCRGSPPRFPPHFPSRRDGGGGVPQAGRQAGRSGWREGGEEAAHWLDDGWMRVR